MNTISTPRTLRLGGDLEIARLGYGAMRLTGQPWNFGRYPDWEGGKALLRRASELGVGFFDTALAYGPDVNEELVAEALEGTSALIATKGGVDKPEVGRIVTDGSRDALRANVERSLKNLGRETIDLYQLHRVDPNVPVEDSVGALAELQGEGKVRFIGLSNVSLDQYERAAGTAPIASVQNRFNIAERDSIDVVQATLRDGAAFIPYGPLGANPIERGAPLTSADGPLAEVASELGASRVQVAIAWLLSAYPHTIAIPATTTLTHLEENVAAGALDLTRDQMSRLDATAEERS